MNTDVTKMRLTLPGLLVAGVVSLAVAGCGGGGHASPVSSSSSTAGGQSASTPAAAATAGIPQHNGGDHDSDNTGGPSDGDGDL
jgi:hypothetical protein